ncbi:MAG TPA: hypothetical protein VK812_19270 [Candidatus Binatus sp.]|jgi:hypothetical protein|nr:hypothetical protein [Candidatus Binatus sp.]
MAKIQFTDARWKIRWASRHIAKINAFLHALNAPDGYTVREDFDAQTGQQFIEYGFKRKFPGKVLALHIGDAVHSLNCALDYSWMKTLKKISPASVSAYSKFPIYSESSGVENALRSNKIKEDSALHKIFTSEIKPYAGGNDALWTIHEIDIADKHHLLIPSLEVGVTSLSLKNDKQGTRNVLCVFTLENLYRYNIPENETFQGNDAVNVKVVFGEEIPPKGQEIIPILRKLPREVLNIVERLERLVETGS